MWRSILRDWLGGVEGEQARGRSDDDGSAVRIYRLLGPLDDEKAEAVAGVIDKLAPWATLQLTGRRPGWPDVCSSTSASTRRPPKS